MLDLLLKGAVVIIESFSMKIQHIFKIIGDKISIFHAELGLHKKFIYCSPLKYSNEIIDHVFLLFFYRLDQWMPHFNFLKLVGLLSTNLHENQKNISEFGFTIDAPNVFSYA